MLDNKNTLLYRLSQLGLTTDESRIYLELLKEPATHLKLARATDINRTKVYRIADDLEKRSLITVRTDDRGAFLVAADPATLEVDLVTQEESIKRKRAVLRSVLPTLEQISIGDQKTFVVQMYEGTSGFKQMLWHELKTKNEALVFGSGTITDLVDDLRWADKHRAMTIEAGYTIREVLNNGEKEKPFTFHGEFMNRFNYRNVPMEVLWLQNQIVIYNDTVATYNWREGEKVGFEVINHSYANMMRQVFETYWKIGLSGPKPGVL